MRLPGYELRGRLARSEVLDVHAAWSHERECPVVVKTLRPGRRRDRAAARALRREGRLLRRLAHPHLVRAYDVITEPHDAVVLEMLGGETLAHLLRRRRLGAAELRHLGEHLCSAVGYLHGAGYLHLDLKPSNVIADGGRAKVIDLSIARRPGRARAGVGTWCYQAPEQAAGGLVTAAADVWGLGTVLFEAATGMRAFADDGRAFPQLHDRAAGVRTLRARLPRALAGAIDACLEPEPAGRPALPELRAAIRR